MLTDRSAAPADPDRDVRGRTTAAFGPRSLVLRVVKDERVAFVFVGGVNALLGLGWFVAFQLLFGQHLGRFGYLLSLVCAYAVAIFCAFLLYRYLVFRVRGRFWLDLLRFTLVNCVGFGLNAVLLPAVVETTGARPIYAQAGVTLAVAVISYLGHKYFSFRRAKTHHAES